MLELILPGGELYDEKKGQFIIVKPQAVRLEHSLIAISKWEAFYKKPFLTRGRKSVSESVYYIQCMTLTSGVDPLVYNFVDSSTLAKVAKYIDDPMSATRVRERQNGPPNREVMTSEVIYYYMIAFNIPMECQKWHLNRLITLIRVCGIKSQPGKKMNSRQVMTQNRELNELRKKQLNTTG